MEEESWPGSRRAWGVLKTPTTATSRNGCVIGARMSLARLAQAEALHLATGRERELVHEAHPPGHLVIGHVLAAPCDARRFVEGVAAATHHVGLRHLAQAVDRRADDRELCHARMGQHDALDLGGEGVEAAGNEHVLLAVSDTEVPVLADQADVPRAQVPPLVEGDAVGPRVVGGAARDVAALDEVLAGLARWHGASL